MTIGAAIIAKDAEKYFAQCLESIRSICSQIVVIDTGSKDLTPKIATKYGADVYFHRWQNDFSEARNFALGHIHTDWVLSIDTDEELAGDSMNSIIEIINSTNSKSSIGGISVILNNYLDEPRKISKQHRFTRIFRNDKKVKFSGKIHEQIADALYNSGLEIIESNVIFNHYGYIGKNISKEARNKELLEAEIANNRQDDFLQFHLAITEFSMGNFDSAYDKFMSLSNSNQLSSGQKEEVKIKTAQILLQKNGYEQAINCLNFTSETLDNEGLRLNIIATAYLSMRNFKKSKEIFNSPEILQSKLVDISILENANKIFLLLGI